MYIYIYIPTENEPIKNPSLIGFMNEDASPIKAGDMFYCYVVNFQRCNSFKHVYTYILGSPPFPVIVVHEGFFRHPKLENVIILVSTVTTPSYNAT